MITKDNYFDIASRLDFDNLPEALKNGHKLVQGAAKNNWSAYNTNDNIRRVVDAYFEKLDQWTKKNPQKDPKKEATPKQVRKQPQASTPAKKNYKGLNVEIRPASKGSKKFIVWDVKRKMKFANETFTSIEEAEQFIEDNNMVLIHNKADKKEHETTEVEKVSPEVAFIKRYVGLHGKVKTQDEILRLLTSLQKAILEKRIRKTSPYAAEIEKIQEQLIKCYEKMGDTIEVKIDSKSLDRYNEIAFSEKAMLSVSYIRQYINLHGKKGVKDKAKILMDRIHKAVEKSKLDKNDPYADRLNMIYQSLRNYIAGQTTAPEISKSQLNGLMGIFNYMATRRRKKKVGKYLQKIYELENGMGETGDETEEDPDMPLKGDSGVIPSTELAGMEFETIGLQGKYRDLIGDPCVGFSAMVYGLPKSGKSTLCLDFAKHLAENHGKVLYCAIEEKFGYMDIPDDTDPPFRSKLTPHSGMLTPANIAIN